MSHVPGRALTAENTLRLVHWAEALHRPRPAAADLTELYRSTRQKLAGPGLELTAQVEQASRLERAADLVARYAADQPESLAELLPDMDPGTTPCSCRACRSTAIDW
jgi:hypothetical protein